MKIARMLLPLLMLLGFWIPCALWLSQLRGSQSLALFPWWTLMGDTLTVALGGATLALVLGSVVALALALYRVPGAKFIRAIFLLPLLLPTAVVTAAVQSVCLKWLPALAVGRDAAVLVVGVQGLPWVLLLVGGALLSLPQVEQRALHFVTAMQGLRVLLTRLRGVMLLSFALVFLLTLPRMEVTGYTGVPWVLGSQALAAFTGSSEEVLGWLLVLLAMTVSLPLLGWVLSQRHLSERALGVEVGAVESRSDSTPKLGDSWGRGNSWYGNSSILVLWGIAAVACWAALQMAIDAGLPPWPGARSWLGFGHPLDGGLLIELLRSLGLAFLLVYGGWSLAVATRSRRLWGIALALPLLVPENLPALALLQGVHWRLPQGLLDTPFLLTVAQGVRFAGVGYLVGVLGVLSVPRGEERAAEFLSPTLQRRLLFGRAWPTLRCGVLVILVLVLGEVECSALLAPPGYDVPSVVLSSFLHYRYDADAARLSVTMATLAAVVGLLLWRMRRQL